MGWPYKFITLSEEEKHARRISLDSHASIAHWSAFAPAALYLALRLANRIRRVGARRGGGRYQEVPNSPVAKSRRLSPLGELERRWWRIRWWACADVEAFGAVWGQRDEWVLGLAWTVWLLACCVHGTGRDYLHLTKSFGMVAVSQLPIQYMLSLKTLNPFSYVFRSSHERVNRYHRVLGRIIYFLLTLHAIFYNIYFVGVGIWFKRFFAPVVFYGVVAYVGFHVLNGTAVTYVRQLSYRVFFITHLAMAFSIPVLVYFHAGPARYYLVEALLLFGLDLGARKIITVLSPAKVELIPNTDLIKITAPMPANKLSKYRRRPGSHIYLSIPPDSRPSNRLVSKSYLIYEFLYNPFTVASINEQAGTLTLVARARGGPLSKRLCELTMLGPDAKVPINIEGPYGAAGKVFHELLDTSISRILLIAGGVGAIFTIPIYQAILAENPHARIQLVWAARSPGDTTWPAANADGKTVLDDKDVQPFLTGDMGVADDEDNASGVPMETFHNRQRPKIDKIIDDTFRMGANEKIAVLVCGPVEMTNEVRRNVNLWAMKGRQVWYHSESFGL